MTTWSKYLNNVFKWPSLSTSSSLSFNRRLIYRLRHSRKCNTQQVSITKVSVCSPRLRRPHFNPFIIILSLSCHSMSKCLRSTSISSSYLTCRLMRVWQPTGSSSKPRSWHCSHHRQLQQSQLIQARPRLNPQLRRHSTLSLTSNNSSSSRQLLVWHSINSLNSFIRLFNSNNSNSLRLNLRLQLRSHPSRWLHRGPRWSLSSCRFPIALNSRSCSLRIRVSCPQLHQLSPN